MPATSPNFHGPALRVEPLTAEAFAPFGNVIEATDAARQMQINAGFATRFHDLAKVDLGNDDGRTLINIFRAQPRSLPMALTLLERHPLGSQAFVPLVPQPYLVVVAPGDAQPDLANIRCFLATGAQGVNYARATWHHPLLSLQGVSDFLVVDRGGPGDNLEEKPLTAGQFWIDAL